MGGGLLEFNSPQHRRLELRLECSSVTTNNNWSLFISTCTAGSGESPRTDDNQRIAAQSQGHVVVNHQGRVVFQESGSRMLRIIIGRRTVWHASGVGHCISDRGIKHPREFRKENQMRQRVKKND